MRRHRAMKKPQGDPGGEREAPSDPLSQAIAAVAARSQLMIGEFLARQARDRHITELFDPFQLGDAFRQMTAQMMATPERLIDAQFSLWGDYLRLWQSTADCLLGGTSDPNSAVVPPEGAAAWRQERIFDFIKQSFLLTARWVQALEGAADGGKDGGKDGGDGEIARQIDFFTTQFVEAMDPQSFFADNPDLLSLTVESSGATLVRGLDHLLGELGRASRDDRIAPARRGLAPLFSDDHIELIGWPTKAAPSVTPTAESPLLFIPPWTDSPRLFEDDPAASLLDWIASQRYAVYLLRWRLAPEEDLAGLLAGLTTAMTEIRRLSGRVALHGVGFDLGGTLLAIAQAWLAARGEDGFTSLTLLASPLDFADSGVLSVFIDEAALGSADGIAPLRLRERLRANDLLWSYVIDCFQGGQSPLPWDWLTPRADRPPVPEKLQRFYLHSLYQENALMTPGALILEDTPIDLACCDQPTFLLALSEDHLVPWRNIIAAIDHLSGRVTSLRGGRGHFRGTFARQGDGWREDWLKWLIKLNRSSRKTR